MKNFFSILTPIIIAIQETWFLPTDQYNFQLSNYTLYRHDELYGQRRHGGVALYIQNDYTHSEITLNTDLQAVACTVYLNGRNVDVCNIYIPPDFDNSELLRNLNHLIAQFNNPVILGDFNARSPAWWDEQPLSARGKIIEDFLDTQDLVTLNCNQPTHFSLTHNSESAIDLSLSSPCLATWFQWMVDGDIRDSDHYPISLQFTFGVSGISSFVPRWNLARADWVKFAELCEMEHHERFDDPVEGLSYISNTILSAAQQSIPVTKPCKKGIPVPWWTPDVRQAIAKRKRAFRAYLRLRTDEALVLRNRERATAKRVIRTAKRNSWQTFLSSFTSSTPLSKVWNLVRRLSGKKGNATFPVLKIPQTGITVSAPNDIVNCLAETIAHTSSNARYPPQFIDKARRLYLLNRNALHSDNLEEYNAPFSLHELDAAIYSSGNTSVGPDKLHYSFFRHLSESSKLFVLQTFNQLFCAHMYPDDWKDSIVVALLKPGKVRYNPQNYRPIAMTSCLGKLLERMVAKRLSFTFQQRELLSKYQCGFRKHHSPVDHLIRLESDIRKGYKRKQYTTAIFLDIKNAFDMVYKPALIYKLARLGIKGNMSFYILNFLSGNRRFRVRHRSIFSNVHETENGLPQGSCLSPILFNVMIDDLFHNLPSGISYSLFADDSAIWCTTPELDHGIQRLQNALYTIDKWSSDNGLEFSAEKSALMVFTRRPQTEVSFLPKLNGVTIPQVHHFKFLGVVLDSRLSMNHHVKHIQAKCKKRLNLFRCLTSTPAGADRSTLLKLYKALVLPIIEYGSIMYAGGNPSCLVKLEACQNHFVRLALGAMKTSPIQSLLVEANITPLSIRRMDLSMRYFTKVQLFPTHAASSAITVLPRLHFNYLGRCEKRTGLTIASRIKKYQDVLGYVLPTITPLPPYRKAPWLFRPLQVSLLVTDRKDTLSTAEIQQTFLRFQALHDHFRFIFTDGSKHDNAVGVGLFSLGLPETRLRLHSETSVFSAELHAIFLALQLIRQYNIQHACICSDSKSAVQSLMHINATDHAHLNILHLHEDLVDAGIEVQFLWLPGHSGISGNERADHYAKQALALPNISATPFNPNSIRRSIKYYCHHFQQLSWDTDGVGTHLHRIKPHLGSWSSSTRQSCREEKVLTRLRIGHTYFTHSFIFERRPRPDCARCRTVLTIEHIVLHCPIYRSERKPLQDYCRAHGVPFALSVVLGDEHPVLLNSLFTFLTASDLLRRF